MNKLLYYPVALAVSVPAMSGLTACSADEPMLSDTASGDEVEVLFTVDVPSTIQSRADSLDKGTYATCLQYAVYDTSKPTEVKASGLKSSKTSISRNDDGTFSVRLKLLRGSEYNVVFWADAPTSPYTFNATQKKITVKYGSANDATADAFFASETLTVSSSERTKEVTLHRPLSKIEVFTSGSDYGLATGSTYSGYLNSSDKIEYTNFTTKAYTTMNFDGTLADLTDVTFTPAAYTYKYEYTMWGTTYTSWQCWKLTINNETYNLIAANYMFLADVDGATVDCSFQFGNADWSTVGEETTFTNIPVKQNSRTRIYGNFFTESVDYTVDIDSNFGEYSLQPVESAQEAEVRAAFKDGGKVTLTDDFLMPADLEIGSESVEIDLNNFNLIFTTVSPDLTLPESSNVKISNGTVKNYIVQETNSSFYVNKDATLTLDKVTMNVQYGSGIYVGGENATVNVSNSVLKALYYGIGTNAGSPDNYGVVINLEGTQILDANSSTHSTGVILNVPGTLTIKDCDIETYNQAVIVRGGEATITGSTLYVKRTLSPTVNYDFEEWGQGNMVPAGALVIGNRNDGAYQYPTTVTVSGTEFNRNIPQAGGTHHVYVWPNTSAGNGVTLNWGDGNTFTVLDKKDVQINTNNCILTGLNAGDFTDITPATE
jgi:hypothetical protein